MTNTTQFSLANRKQLADLLNYGMRDNAKQRFDARRDALRDSLIKELAKEKGALTIHQKIDAMTGQIKELQAELSDLGFALDYSGDLVMNDKGDRLYDKPITWRIEEKIGTEADIDARFDSTLIAMMTVASLEDADKLLKSVSEI